jgi:hypothetical protein
MTPVAVAPTIEPGPVKPLQKDAMTRETKMPIRLASPADARAFGKLLYAFNLEFGEETPAGELIARRAAPLIENGELTVWGAENFVRQCRPRGCPSALLGEL